jgi:hypothetical protein
MYEYRMVQVPPTINVKARDQSGKEAAIYLEGIANQGAKDGFEFYRVDTVGVVVEPGCLAGLFGAKRTLTEYYVVTLRRPLRGA